MKGEEEFIDRLDDDIVVLDMDRYGDFWRYRRQLRFETFLSDNVLTIEIPGDSSPVEPMLSLVVDDGANLDDIVVQYDTGERIPVRIMDWEQGDRIVWFNPVKPGDFDQNGKIGPEDIAGTIQSLAGLAPGGSFFSLAAFDKGFRIGLPELIYQLEVLTGK